MDHKSLYTIPGAFSETLKKHSDRNAMSFVGNKPMTYGDIYRQIRAVMAMLEYLDIHPGDRVAILSSGMPTGGFAIMPSPLWELLCSLLPDFHPDEIRNILEHAEASAIFISDGLRSKDQLITF